MTSAAAKRNKRPSSKGKKRRFSPSDIRSSRKRDYEFDLMEILNRRKPLIVTSGFMGVLLAAAYMMFMPPTFESTSRLLLMQSEAASLASNNNSVGDSVSQDLLATHMTLIQSPLIVNQALTNSMLSDLPSLVDQAGDRPTMRYVVDNLYISRGGKGNAKNSHTLSVAFRHTNPEDAEKVVNAVVAQYQQFVAEKFKDINKEAVSLISTARTELEDEIGEMAKEYEQFRMDSPLISNDGMGGNVHELRFQQLATELANVAIAIDETNSRLQMVKTGLEQMENMKRPPIEKLTLIDEKAAVRLGVLVTVERGESRSAAFLALQPERAAGAQIEYTSILDLRAKLTQAKSEYGSNHPEVRFLESRIKEMEKFLTQREPVLGVTDDRKELTPDDVMNAYVAMLETDLVALKQRKIDMERQQLEAEEESKKLIVYELQNQELLTKMSRHEALYDSVVTRLRDINMQQDATALILEEIEKPEVGKKVSPSIPIAAVIAVLATFLFSGTAILIAELNDKRLHNPEDLERVYNAPVLGMLPNFQDHSDVSAIIKTIRKKKDPIAGEILTYHAPTNPISEQIRTIRTQLVFQLGDQNQLLATTSPNQGDGKTTVVTNLAISLATAGKSVLIVDCDMRRPNLHGQFGIDYQKGLADVLLDQLEIEDAIKAGPVEKLSLMTAGQIANNPAELLSSEKFRNLLEVLRNKFDIVILDCPPLLPVTDPAIIAPMVDHVLLVTQLDEHSGPKALRCHKILASLGTHLIGIVVNKTQVKTSGYYYQDYYTSYYKAD
ncbi:MAG: polysaccharide biosynthesis tyrosine autokinase [Pirellulales bacterium]